MAARKIFDAHQLFILQQVAAFIDGPTTIRDRLEDVEFADRFGFSAVKITKQRAAQIINRLDPDEIKAERERYLADFDDLPLAHEKVRCEELVKIYRELDNPPKGSIYALMNVDKLVALKLRTLAQLKDEIGEDVDKLAKALAASGGSSATLHIDLGSLPDDDKQTIRANIAAGYRF